MRDSEIESEDTRWVVLASAALIGGCEVIEFIPRESLENDREGAVDIHRIRVGYSGVNRDEVPAKLRNTRVSNHVVLVISVKNAVVSVCHSLVKVYTALRTITSCDR